MTRIFSLTTLFAFITFAPSAAYSAPIATCPEAMGPDDERQFTVTVDQGDVACLAYGDGENDIQGDGPHDVIVGDESTDWMFIDKDTTEDNDEGFLVEFGTSGGFTIGASLWDVYEALAIGFKVGSGGETPIWAVFELTNGVLSGDWSVSVIGTDSNNALSGALLYGILDDGRDVQAVPEPASLLLLGGGLSLLARRQMRRKQNKA